MRRKRFRIFALVLLLSWHRRRGNTPDVVDPQTIGDIEQGQLLDAMLAFSETQILAQGAEEASIDGRTMGVLAFAGALLGGTLAAQDLLGPAWWTPLVPVGVASALCLWSVRKKEFPAIGPYALTFYETFGGTGPLPARAQLLSDLDKAFKLNTVRVRNKQRRLRWSLNTLVVGLVIAGSLIAVIRPTTITTSCMHAQIRVQQDRHRSQCRARRTSRSSARVGSSAAAITRPNASQQPRWLRISRATCLPNALELEPSHRGGAWLW
jgi:hypothetical protein